MIVEIAVAVAVGFAAGVVVRKDKLLAVVKGLKDKFTKKKEVVVVPTQPSAGAGTVAPPPGPAGSEDKNPPSNGFGPV